MIQKIFLLETKPRIGIVEDGRAGIAGVRRFAIGHHHFAHHERAIFLGRIGINGDRLEHAIRAFAFGLTRRAAVET